MEIINNNVFKKCVNESISFFCGLEIINLSEITIDVLTKEIQNLMSCVNIETNSISYFDNVYKMFNKSLFLLSQDHLMFKQTIDTYNRRLQQNPFPEKGIEFISDKLLKLVFDKYQKLVDYFNELDIIHKLFINGIIFVKNNKTYFLRKMSIYYHVYIINAQNEEDIEDLNLLNFDNNVVYNFLFIFRIRDPKIFLNEEDKINELSIHSQHYYYFSQEYFWARDNLNINNQLNILTDKEILESLCINNDNCNNLIFRTSYGDINSLFISLPYFFSGQDNEFQRKVNLSIKAGLKEELLQLNNIQNHNDFLLFDSLKKSLAINYEYIEDNEHVISINTMNYELARFINNYSDHKFIDDILAKNIEHLLIIIDGKFGNDCSIIPEDILKTNSNIYVILFSISDVPNNVFNGIINSPRRTTSNVYLDTYVTYFPDRHSESFNINWSDEYKNCIRNYDNYIFDIFKSVFSNLRNITIDNNINFYILNNAIWNITKNFYPPSECDNGCTQISSELLNENIDYLYIPFNESRKLSFKRSETTHYKLFNSHWNQNHYVLKK